MVGDLLQVFRMEGRILKVDMHKMIIGYCFETGKYSVQVNALLVNSGEEFTALREKALKEIERRKEACHENERRIQEKGGAV